MGRNKMIAAGAILAAGTALAAATAAAPTVRWNAPQDRAAIESIEHMIQVETNMDKLMPNYAPNAFVIDIFSPGIYKGADQVRAGFGPQLAKIGSIKHDIRELSIVSDGKMACAAMQIHFDTVMTDGKPLKMTVRELDAFKKIDGRWRIIQQHVALPVDAKTGLAVWDGAIASRGQFKWTPTPPSDAAVSPEQAKREIREWMDTGTLSPTVDFMMKYYEPGNNSLVYDGFYPGEMRGQKEIHDYYASMMNYSGIKVKLPEFVADSDGTLGVQIDTQDMKITNKDGSTQYISLRQSDCMRRVGGRWVSLMELISFPIDAKTGKGIMANPGAFN
jgi:ketosteroid isomerase-like protein